VIRHCRIDFANVLRAFWFVNSFFRPDLAAEDMTLALGCDKLGGHMLNLVSAIAIAITTGGPAT